MLPLEYQHCTVVKPNIPLSLTNPDLKSKAVILREMLIEQREGQDDREAQLKKADIPGLELARVYITSPSSGGNKKKRVTEHAQVHLDDSDWSDKL